MTTLNATQPFKTQDMFQVDQKDLEGMSPAHLRLFYSISAHTQTLSGHLIHLTEHVEALARDVMTHDQQLMRLGETGSATAVQNLKKLIEMTGKLLKEKGRR